MYIEQNLIPSRINRNVYFIRYNKTFSTACLTEQRVTKKRCLLLAWEPGNLWKLKYFYYYNY